MQEKTIELDTLLLNFTIEEENWQLKMPKSQTKVKDNRQTRLLKEVPHDTSFVPVEITDEGDTFVFDFTVDQSYKHWEDLHTLHRNDKLRLLCNVAQLKNYLHARISFFLHPNNLIFNDNLIPLVIYRGIRDIIPPYEINEKSFLKQLQCLSIALLSSKYDFDQLYNGALERAKETEFERRVSDMISVDELINYLHERYDEEQRHAEKQMKIVPVKRFRLFKQLSIIMIILSVLLAAPLIYFAFFSMPYNEHLLDAHEAYLASDYGDVISTLEDEKADKLPKASKYILAHSYINTEHLSADEKESIMKNVSLKSDDNYLLYWIYNGRGAFGDALNQAKYLDDPQLIMYGLIKKIESVKNDPDLDGDERDDELKKLQNDLKDYRKEYDLIDDEEELKENDLTDNETKEEEAEKEDKDKIEKKDKKDKNRKKTKKDE